MIPVWLIVILTIIVGLTILMVLIKPKLAHIEKFDLEVKQPSFSEEQLSFGDQQYDYYQNTMNKEILVNPGLDYGRLYDSVKSPDIVISAKDKSAFQSQIKTDPYNSFTEADVNFCKGIPQPKDLPERPKKAKLACGWWHIPDPATPSTGALGSKTAPQFPESLPKGGQWLWNMKEAQMLEDIKHCKQLTNCRLVDSKAFRRKCGFCNDNSKGIPITDKGEEKYPEKTTCGTKVLMSGDECPAAPGDKLPPTQETIVKCGNLGYPGWPGVRFYSREDCYTLDPKGTWYPWGECLKPASVGGGSYSGMCGYLNGPIQGKTILVCDPTSNGTLSRECLLSLSQGMGYNDKGAIVQFLKQTKRAPSDYDTMAMNLVKSLGVSIPNAILGKGDITKDEAIEVYTNIKTQCTSASQELYREAAKWLVYGTENFDPCDLPDNTRGPFVPQCIQREFRKAGCQPGGNEYPIGKKLFDYNTMTWADVKVAFNKLFKSMTTDNGEEQDVAVKKCLGVNVLRKKDKGDMKCKDLNDDWLVNTSKNPVKITQYGTSIRMIGNDETKWSWADGTMNMTSFTGNFQFKDQYGNVVGNSSFTTNNDLTQLYLSGSNAMVLTRSVQECNDLDGTWYEANSLDLMRNIKLRGNRVRITALTGISWSYADGFYDCKTKKGNIVFKTEDGDYYWSCDFSISKDNNTFYTYRPGMAEGFKSMTRTVT